MKRRDFIAGLGGTAAWPVVALGQQTATPVIGFLHFGSSRQFAFQTTAFGQGLKETGYTEGQNVMVEYRWAEGHYDRLPALAKDLVGRNVDLIAAIGPPCASAAKNSTSVIPIVFTTGTDPVAEGFVASIARPGRNLTGITLLAVQLVPKRLELLSELVPQARKFALLINPLNGYSEPMVRDVQGAASAKGVQLEILTASTPAEIDDAFAKFVNVHPDGLIIGDDPFFTSRPEQVVGLASRYLVPAIYQFRLFSTVGGLISYGPSIVGATHDAGIYAGKILKGAKPEPGGRLVAASAPGARGRWRGR